VAQRVIEHEETSQGTPAAVFALLADGSTWPQWSPIDSFELVEKGDGEPEGVGAVRIFRTGRIKSRERVVTAQPNEVFSYILLSGLPLADYRAVVTLCPAGSGTSIQWRSTFRAKVPGSGWIYQRQLGRFIGQIVKDLAAAAATVPASG
jgi:hypothetical protein